MSRVIRHFRQVIIPRLQATKSIPALAEQIGVDVSTLRKLANGVNTNPTIKVVGALDQALCQGSEFLEQGGVQPEMDVCRDAPSSLIQRSREGETA